MVKSAAKSAADFLFGEEIFPAAPFASPATPEADAKDIDYKNKVVSGVESDVYDYYDGNHGEYDDSANHLGSNPGPPYISNVVSVHGTKDSKSEQLKTVSNPREFKTTSTLSSSSASMSDSESSKFKTLTFDPNTLGYDPITKTLFVPKHISESLAIADGSVLPIPHDVLRDAVADGQIQIVDQTSDDVMPPKIPWQQSGENIAGVEP